MNEGTGTTAADSSGNGNTGTLPNGGTWASGIASNAVVLDGVNDYVSIGDSATLENNATFTFAGWINADQFFSARDNYLMYKDKVLRWGFLSSTSRQPSVDIGSGSGNPGWQGASTSTTQINSNEWTHLAVTYTNSTLKFYVNGLLTDTISKTYTMGSNNKAYSISTSAQAFDGKLDDVRYYNRALSDSEIGQVYGEQITNNVYLADALGSSVALTDSAKAIQTEYDYEPFGATTGSGASTANPYKFTGREDDGTGLYFYRARYYDPVLARFVSEDPLEYVGGMNFYAYVLNAPVDSVDPFGLTNDPGDFGGPLVLPQDYSFVPDPVNDTRAYAAGRCSLKCLDELRISLGLGGAGALAGLPVSPKPFVLPGSSPATSLAGKYLPQLLPQRIPPVWAPTAANPAARTAVLGRAAGRWLPIVSWAVLLRDYFKYWDCFDKCMCESNNK